MYTNVEHDSSHFVKFSLDDDLLCFVGGDDADGTGPDLPRVQQHSAQLHQQSALLPIVD